jgi:hypothetical protein
MSNDCFVTLATGMALSPAARGLFAPLWPTAEKNRGVTCYCIRLTYYYYASRTMYLASFGSPLFLIPARTSKGGGIRRHYFSATVVILIYLYSTRGS